MLDFSFHSRFKTDDNIFYQKITLNDYVFLSLSRNISDSHLDLIEEAFLDKWNSSTGMYLGDGYIKNHVYHYLESIKLEEYPKQDLVDQVVDLMLDYMAKIGEWDKGYNEN